MKIILKLSMLLFCMPFFLLSCSEDNESISSKNNINNINEVNKGNSVDAENNSVSSKGKESITLVKKEQIKSIDFFKLSNGVDIYKVDFKEKINELSYMYLTINSSNKRQHLSLFVQEKENYNNLIYENGEYIYSFVNKKNGAEILFNDDGRLDVDNELMVVSNSCFGDCMDVTEDDWIDSAWDWFTWKSTGEVVAVAMCQLCCWGGPCPYAYQPEELIIDDTTIDVDIDTFLLGVNINLEVPIIQRKK